MAFQQGLSGLNMSAKALDAVGNNIANSGTVGFKSAITQFGDVYAATIGGASSANLIGQGGSIMSVAQTFTQGNVTSTNNPLDIAINGNGFLRFQPTLDDLTPQYSRNGQLHLNSEGYLVNALDQFLNVYPATVGGDDIDTTAAVPLQLSNAQLEPKQTGWTGTGVGGVSIGANLDVRDKRAVGATDPDWDPVVAPFVFDPVAGDPTPSMYNFSTSATIYDQTGQPHVMTMYFVRQGDPLTGAQQRQWEPHFILDNKYEIPASDLTAGVTNPDLMMFTASGQISNDLVTPAVSATRFTLDLANAFDGTGAVDLTSDAGVAMFDPATPLEFDFSTMTQYGSAYDVNRLTQDGYGPGRLSGIAIDGEGQITARYSNGKTKLQGQIMLSTFQNPNGLVPLGNNLWASSAASGEALDGTPQAGSRGSIQAGAVEDANVDLTQELVNMITLQRAYQANAQTIKTQDQILQTLVNLR